MKELYKSIAYRSGYALFVLLIVGTSVALLATPYYKFAALPGVLLLLMLLLGRYPQAGFYLIVFLIPFGAYRVLSHTYQYITISKFVGIWIVIILLFYFLVKKSIPFDIRSNLWPWLLSFLVINLISTLMSHYYISSFDNLRRLLAAFIFVVLTMIFVNRKGFEKTLSVTVIVGVTVSSILSIIGYIFDIQLFAMNVGSEAVKRGIGTAQNPNHFAAMIIFSLPLIAYWFFSSRKIWWKLLALALFVLTSTAIILTYSRSAAIVYTILFLLIVFENIRRFKPKYIGFVMSLATILVLLFLILVPPSYLERQKSVTDTTDTAIGRRISYLYVAWDSFKGNPILGSGPGTFRKIYENSVYAYQYARGKEDYIRDAHNTYLEILIGSGIMGISIFILILIVALRNFHKAINNFRHHGKENMASLVGAYRLSFVSLLIYFLMMSSAYHKYLWLSIALSQIALSLSLTLPEEDNIENHYDLGK